MCRIIAKISVKIYIIVRISLGDDVAPDVENEISIKIIIETSARSALEVT